MLNRRQALLGAGACALGTAVVPAWPATGLDLDNRRDLLTALAKMRGATDDRLTIGYVVGMRYAVPDHRAIPMMGILAATFSQYRRLGDEAFEVRSIEVAFFTDAETGALLEKWKNPVTGAVVAVPQTRLGPSILKLTVDGLQVPRPSGEAAGMELRHRFLAPVVVGDDVWITEDIRVEQGGGVPRPFVYNELSTYHTKKSFLDDAALAMVPTTVDYQSLITYRPWMGFGDAPGHTIARGAGARVTRIEELPAAYLALARQHHPDVIRDARAVLAAAG